MSRRIVTAAAVAAAALLSLAGTVGPAAAHERGPVGDHEAPLDGQKGPRGQHVQKNPLGEHGPLGATEPLAGTTPLGGSGPLSSTGPVRDGGPLGGLGHGHGHGHGLGHGKQTGTGDHLAFTVTDTGDASRDGSYTVRCRPTGGDHPTPHRACAALKRATADGKDPFKPVPRGGQCTMIYGGPAKAHVTGVWRGQEIDARFERSNGCEIDRWDALVPALPTVS